MRDPPHTQTLKTQTKDGLIDTETDWWLPEAGWGWVKQVRVAERYELPATESGRPGWPVQRETVVNSLNGTLKVAKGVGLKGSHRKKKILGTLYDDECSLDTGVTIP